MKHGRLILAILSILLTAGVLLGALYLVLHTRRLLAHRRHRSFPLGIVIHHTATPPKMGGRFVSVTAIDNMHALRGFKVTDPKTSKVYHIGYHFLVLQDGTIHRGRPEYLRGAHARGHADMLGIALVGNFEPASNRGRQGPEQPTPAQLTATIWLTRMLMAKYRLTARQVYLHRDLRQTACPGSNFPRKRFYHALQP